ncbi:site-specific DNA-methyltransferase [Thiothrix nivea]|uniref:DNA methylase N-4/N-6 domain protein n=1 Tax=Thiothrix nivea (strain ATCC 35100 / DSM 5205 / JP2) TaxID=870187 RepID=A0A656HGZ1_THINJ|nr:site-specific DNA-methyltransferase [Thiothrix nivea]EIJ36178.1 DNA methylase N-4/N-6 domain protein [Thiothrix nivea DSM 5205]
MPLLDWLNKPESLRTAARVPYRLLEGVPELGYGETPNHNLLIQGDNLEALKALLPLYAGRVKCIYIDPPYNTRSAFEHYDDNLEHSQWLSMMYPRLELLRELLAEDGSLWVSIDDNEGHYLKVMLDEIFGRRNFILDIAWQKRDGAPNDRTIASIHEHILVWGKSILQGKNNEKTAAEINFNLMPRTDKADSQYRVFDEPNGPDPNGPFRKIDTTANGKGGRMVDSLVYPIKNPYTGEEVWPRKGTCWRHKREEMERLQQEGRLYWGVKGTATTPMRKLYVSEAKQGMTTPSMWSGLALNQHASREIELLFGEKASFETPKPEGLIERILHIATNSGDWVLDSFLGSGTTAAVAHKMGRHYIGVEMGDHAVTHCQPRLQKVVDGEQGGISKAVNWQGGGGFTFCRLGATVFDAFGMIDKAICFPTLAAYLWYLETRTPWIAPQSLSPLLGIHDGTAYYLLYNGILGDRRPQGGNVLTQNVLDGLPKHEGKRVVYGETSRFGAGRLAAEGIVFKQIPYDVRVG